MATLAGPFGEAKPIYYKEKQGEEAKPTTTTKDYYHIFKHLKKPAKELKKLAGEIHQKYVTKYLPNRVFAAMRHFQELVGVIQELQMSESMLNGGGESEEVWEFRQIEYHLREFVEDHLRKAAESIVKGTPWQDKIPGYSVGGVPFSMKKIEENVKKPNVKSENGKLLHQVEKCLKIFIDHDIKDNTE